MSPDNDKMRAETAIIDQQLLDEYIRASEELKKIAIPNVDRPAITAETITDQQLLERYIHEAEKLNDISVPIMNYLGKHAWIQVRYGKERDRDKWTQEYQLPLFEAAKAAMRRVTGTDNYLEIWEKKIPERIVKLISESGTRDSGMILVPELSLSDRWRHVPLCSLYTNAIIHESQSELLAGMFQRVYGGGSRSFGGFGGGGTGIAEQPFTLVPKTFPAFVDLCDTYDPSWEILAIYSFQNDRSRDLLFELATRPGDEHDGLADFAVYYLTLLPNSGVLLPRAKILLNDTVANEQENYPDRARHFLNENGSVIDPFRESKRVNGIWVDGNPQLLRIARLVRGLEFNEKIPTEERKRFDLFRREMAINWSLSNKWARRPPQMSATLRKEEERFRIYFREFVVPLCIIRIYSEYTDDFSKVPSDDPYWQNHKMFLERELEKSIYTKHQKEYIRSGIRNVDERSKH